jgi:glycosyltransferase involved in cell wall biosynthesis
MEKVLIVANWDWVIYNFRQSLAKSLQENRYEVVLVSPKGKYVEEMRERFHWIEWPLERRSLNPLGEVSAVWKLAQIYKDEAPDLIHHDTIKPNLYGALAAQINTWRGVWDEPPQLLNSFMGIGFLFSERKKARILRSLVVPIMQFAMNRRHVFTTFSNRADRDTFANLGLIESANSRVMVSEFVNTDRFQSRDGQSSEGKLIVLMAARLLWDKGVQEFVSAAQMLRESGTPIEFWLAGEPDTETPGFVPEQRLDEWNQTGVINWLGYCSDMPEVLSQADIAVLPTHYNEGLPRFLVEAGATGLPLIATDIEACRRVVEDGKNGFVIPKRNPEQLAKAIEKLAQDASLRKAMGEMSREKVIAEFAEEEVIEEWLDLYEHLLAKTK